MFKAHGRAAGRQKRFILSEDTATGFPFPVPTTYPIPTLPNNPGAITPPSRSTSRLSGGGFAAPQAATPMNSMSMDLASVLNAAQVSCPVKRSTDHIRLYLDDNILAALYARLVGKLDVSRVAMTYADVLQHFVQPSQQYLTKVKSLTSLLHLLV